MPFPRKQPDRYCESCGSLLVRKPKESSRAWKMRKYCDKTCANAKKHPEGWAKEHAEAQQFKGKSCEACGLKKNLHVHHCDGIPSHNTADNCQTLCTHCHGFWHKTANRVGRKPEGRMPELWEEEP